MRILVGVPMLLLLAACSTHAVRHVDIIVAPESVSVRAPSYIAVGDSLTVRVQDRRYVNRYEARHTEGTLTAIARAPLFGSADLQKIDLRFQPSRTPAGGDEPPTRVNNLFFLERLDTADEVADVAQLAQEAEDDLAEVASRFRERLDSLRVVVASDPAEFARLRLLVDDCWVPVADAVASDPAPTRMARLLDSLASGVLDSIAPERLESARRDAEAYALRLDALRALLPAAPPAGSAENSQVGELMERLGTDLADHQALERSANELWKAAGVATPVRSRSALLPSSVQVSGIDLGPWLADPDRLLADLDEIQARVSRVNQHTERLVLALNQLPSWTRTSAAESIFTQLFPAEKEVKVVVVRRDRYAPFSIASPRNSAAPPAKKDPAVTAGTVTVTTTTTVRESTEAGGGGEESKKDVPAAQNVALTSLAAPRMDTVAVVNIPVLQRFRFHLGVGMVYSTLKTGVFQTSTDTVGGVPGVNVVRTGTDENRLLPMAMLSYTVLPSGGRFVDARAYRTLPILAPNVSVQAGISLSDPSQHLYAGVSAEFFPGLDIGVGHHFGYVQTTSREGQFVPLPQPATTNRWMNDWAYSFTLDAQTFMAAFGKLIGLK